MIDGVIGPVENIAVIEPPPWLLHYLPCVCLALVALTLLASGLAVWQYLAGRWAEREEGGAGSGPAGTLLTRDGIAVVGELEVEGGEGFALRASQCYT